MDLRNSSKLEGSGRIFESCDISLKKCPPHMQLVYSSMNACMPVLSCACLYNNSKWCLLSFVRPTTEIPLKECSAYGQIYQGGEREEPHIYERPQ